MDNIIKQQLEKLKSATFQHTNDKRYAYRPRKPKMKGGKVVKDKNEKIIYTNQLYAPTPSKTVFLSFAFNMALENYRNIRPSTSIKIIQNLSDLSDMLLRFFNNKYYNRIEDISTDQKLITSKQNYKYAAIERFRQIEYKLYGIVDRLRNYHSHYIHEPGVLHFSDMFDHDDSTMSQADFEEAKEWFQKRFDDAHTHLIKSLSKRKYQLTIEQINAPQKDKEILENKVEEIDRVIKTFNHINFLHVGGLTQEGQLFIACMFLTRRQAKIVLDKWRGFKDVEGYGKTLHTFFTYYSIKERYSINNYNDNLLKFRNICSRLSTVPYIENDHLNFIYEKIKYLNQVNYDKLDRIPIGSKNEKAKAKRNALQKKIIPVRRKKIFTEVLLQYLLDNEVFKGTNIRIAIKKNLSDTLTYYDEYPEINKEESLTQLKNRITDEKDNTKRQKLLNHFKELKRNFIFCTPEELQDKLKSPEELRSKMSSEDRLKREAEENQAIQQRLLNIYNNLNNNGSSDSEDKEQNQKHQNVVSSSSEPSGYRFSIKRRNALIRMDYEGNPINVTLSPDFLLKWVFLHLEGKDSDVIKQLKTYVQMQYQRRQKDPKSMLAELKKDGRYNHIPIYKLLPQYIINEAKDKKPKSIKKRIKIKLKAQIDSLKSFVHRNSMQAKPWKYASKQKIDIVMNYLHCKLLEDVYINQINEDEPTEEYIRHTAFNMNTYNIAREYFRFFGRYENHTIHELEDYLMPGVINKMKEEHAVLFSYIRNDIKRSQSLEELYEAVVQRQIKYYTKYKHEIDKHSDEILKSLFKISSPPIDIHKKKLVKEMFLKAIDVSPEIISIQKEMPKEWSTYIDAKHNPNKKYNNYSEYSFIRYVLDKKDNPATNVDFIFQHIMKEEEGSKRKISKVFKLLLKQKTQDLILWNVAKHYWLKANRSPYSLDKIVTNRESSVFQEFCTFNKVYQQELDYEIKVDGEFWEKNKKKFKKIYDELPEDNKSLSFTIMVSARKYDNKFILYETQLIKEYMLWYHYDSKSQKIKQIKDYKHPDPNIKTTFDLTVYDDVIKLVYKELIKSVSYIGALLRAEKKVIDGNKVKFMSLMNEKYESKEKLNDYYLALSDKKDDNDLYQAFLAKIRTVNLINRTNEEDKKTFEEYLVLFRNYALHYQLQDPKRRKKIMRMLGLINNKVGQNEYITRE